MWSIDKRLLKPALATILAGAIAGCASGPKVYDRAALAPAEQSLINSKPAALRM